MSVSAFKASEEFFSRATPPLLPRDKPARNDILERQVRGAERRLAQYRADVRAWQERTGEAAATILELGSKASVIAFRIDLLAHIAVIDSSCEMEAAEIERQINEHRKFESEINGFAASRNVRRMLHRLNAQMVDILKQLLGVRKGYSDFLHQQLLPTVDARLRKLAGTAAPIDQVLEDLEDRYPTVAAYLAR